MFSLLNPLFHRRWSWWRGPAVSTWRPTSTPQTVWQFAPLLRATTVLTWWTWPTATPVSTSQRWWSVRTLPACLLSTCAHYCPPVSSISTQRPRCTTQQWNGSKQIHSTTRPGWTRSCLRLEWISECVKESLESIFTVTHTFTALSVSHKLKTTNMLLCPSGASPAAPRRVPNWNSSQGRDDQG